MKTTKKNLFIKLIFLNQIIQITSYKNLPIKKSLKLEIDEEALSSVTNSGADVFNISSPFYQDFCNNIYYIVDMTQEDKVKSFYDNSDLCNGCTKITGNLPKYPTGLGKLLSIGAFNCFTGKGIFGNIGFLLSLLILISLFILSIGFCFCEVHFTKSLIYQRIPSNPPQEDKKEEKKDEKKDDNKEEKKEENKEEKKENEEKKDNENKNEDNNNNDNNNNGEEKNNEENTDDGEKKDNLSENSEKKVEKVKDIHYKDKEYETYDPSNVSGTGKYCYFFSRKFIQQIEVINIIYFHEKHMSYCLDISFFLFSLLFDLFITCLLYGDSSVHKQFEKGKSMDFVTIALNGIIGVILSKIICYFIHLLIMYNPTLLDIISDSPNHKIKGIKILADFMCLYYTRVTIYFILQYGLFIMCMMHITGFFYRYKKISINALISWVVGAVFIIFISFIISLIYGLCLNISFKRIKKLKEKRLEKLKDDDIIKEEEEIEEEEQEQEEEKEYQPKVNASNGEVLEVKSNLPPMRKTKKKTEEEEENV